MLKILLIAGMGISASAAQAAVISLDETHFDGVTIGLSEGQVPIEYVDPYTEGPRNPVYLPSDYGGSASAPVVSTGGHFVGQSVTDSTPDGCGGDYVVCLAGQPEADLRLDPDAPDVFTLRNRGTTGTGYGIGSYGPTMSGSPRYEGPISVHFSTDVSRVGVFLRGLNYADTTAIQFYARDGSIISAWSNEAGGAWDDPRNFWSDAVAGIRVTEGTPGIAGFSVFSIGDRYDGFSMRGMNFSPVPVPASLPLLGAAMAGLFGISRRVKR